MFDELYEVAGEFITACEGDDSRVLQGAIIRLRAVARGLERDTRRGHPFAPRHGASDQLYWALFGIAAVVLKRQK